MIGRPAPNEAAPYYFRYIDRVPDGDVVEELERQRHSAASLFSTISEEKSLHRYEPGKWSIRQVVNHVSDTERVFLSRAFWFGRGFDSALPSYEQDTPRPVPARTRSRGAGTSRSSMPCVCPL